MVSGLSLLDSGVPGLRPGPLGISMVLTFSRLVQEYLVGKRRISTFSGTGVLGWLAMGSEAVVGALTPWTSPEDGFLACL